MVGELPPIGTRNTKYDSAVATAQQHPNQAVLIAEGVRAVTINSIRQYVRREPYATDEGHIEVSMRYSAMVDGERRGTMYFTWVPNQKKGK